MKKMIMALTAALALVVSASSFANVHDGTTNAAEHHQIGTCPVAVQGAHCRGTVGCSCPGFAPITNGDLWQRAYCRNCGHKRMYH